MRRPAILALLAAAIVGASLYASAPGGAASPPPEIGLTATVLTPGTSVLVSGTHWPEGTTLQALLCGAKAVDGSVDCAQNAAVVMTPGPDGSLQGLLQVVLPPKPCPCVVLLTDLSSDYTKRIPVEVVGAANAPVNSSAPAAKPPTLAVDASVSGGTSVASVFGGPAKRTLTLRLHNTGEIRIPHPVVVARWGKGSSPGHVIPSPTLPALAPGATRTVRLHFELDPLSFGSYTVAGVVSGATKPISFESSTSTWPWGLIVVALLLLQLVLLGFRNRARRRLARKEAQARLAEIEPLDTVAAATPVAVTAVALANARVGPPDAPEAQRSEPPEEPVRPRNGTPPAFTSWTWPGPDPDDGSPSEGAGAHNGNGSGPEASEPPISWRAPDPGGSE